MKRRLFELIWAVRRRLSRPVRGRRGAGSVPVSDPRRREWTTTVDAGDDSLGHGYLERWRASARTLIAPTGEQGTSLRLFAQNAPETPAATHPHVMVEAHDLVIDFGQLSRREALRHRPGHQRTRAGYADYRAGALLGAGSSDGPLDPTLFPRDHLRDIFGSLIVRSEVPEVDRIVDEWCLLVSREPYEYENLFHAHTDWLNTFLTLRLLRLEGVSTRVVLIDPLPEGALDGVFARLFTPNAPVLRSSSFGADRVRFRRAAFVPPGYSSLLWSGLQEGTTFATVGLLRDYGRFFRSAFFPPPVFAPEDPVRITLITRRPYPERGPVLHRQFRSEEALAAALSSIPGVVVQVVDLAELTVEEQVQVAARTEILIGAHGAGLAHCFAMAEHGALVEIVAEPAAATFHLYGNIAVWTGRLFTRVEAPERLGWRGSWLDPRPNQLRDQVGALAIRVRERRSV